MEGYLEEVHAVGVVGRVFDQGIQSCFEMRIRQPRRRWRPAGPYIERHEPASPMLDHEPRHRRCLQGRIDHQDPIVLSCVIYTCSRHGKSYLCGVSGVVGPDDGSEARLEAGGVAAVHGLLVALILVILLGGHGRKDRVRVVPAAKYPWHV